MRKEVKEAIADGIEFVAGAIGVAIGVAAILAITGTSVQWF